MKIALIALSFACLIGALQANPLNFHLEDADNFANAEPQVLPNEDGDLSTVDDPELLPLEEDDLNDEEESQDLGGDLDTTRPPPGPPVPRPRPPQIHHNAVKSQGPLSGRLTNVLHNVNGIQSTIQRNNIDFEFLYNRAVQKLMESLGEQQSA